MPPKSTIEKAASSEHHLLMLDQQWAGFLAEMDSEQGMDTAVYEARLESLVGNSEADVDRACRVLRQLEGQDKLLKEEIDRLSAKRKRAQAHALAIKIILLALIKRLGGSFKTAQNSLFVGRSTTVKLREGFEVKAEFGKIEPMVYVSALAEQLFKMDPKRAAELGLFENVTEFLGRR